MTYDEHEHVHTFDWQAELEHMRQAAAHFYEHQFDWKGHGPQPGFTGPRYFPAAPDWRLPCTLDRGTSGAGATVTLAMSTGQPRQMVVAGQLVFLFEAIENRLTVEIRAGELVPTPH